jgi:type II secretory pathway pseudopilin PulG
MRFATQTNRRAGRRHETAFTLVEVLAALTFMAIVIPVAVAALRVASLSGEVAARKAEAARVADRVLNEAVVTGTWNQPMQRGTINENGREFRWTVRSEARTEDTMQLVTAEVIFSAQGRDFPVRLSTLVPPAQ